MAMTEIERCVRCGYDGPARDFSYWVLVCDDAGDRLAGVCERCLTAVERREIEQDALASLDDDRLWDEDDGESPSGDTGQWFAWDLRPLPTAADGLARRPADAA
jgi:hypothetical protein